MNYFSAKPLVIAIFLFVAHIPETHAFDPKLITVSSGVGDFDGRSRTKVLFFISNGNDEKAFCKYVMVKASYVDRSGQFMFNRWAIIKNFDVPPNATDFKVEQDKATLRKFLA